MQAMLTIAVNTLVQIVFLLVLAQEVCSALRSLLSDEAWVA